MKTHPPTLFRLVAILNRFDQRQLDAAEVQLRRIEASRRVGANIERKAAGRKVESGSELPHSKDWPRAPVHRLVGKGTFIVTGGTYNKLHHFADAQSLDYLEVELFSSARKYDWQLEAWAVFSNHYHFVGHALLDASSLGSMLKCLHSKSARTTSFDTSFCPQSDGLPRTICHKRYI